MITHHTNLLQALIDKHGLKSYLEIGVNDPKANFDKINCESMLGIEPNSLSNENILQLTSDEFFARTKTLVPFDLIFIDGLHHADQVKRDFENSLRCLSDNGFIVIHDVLPDEEQYAAVPRITKKWFGNVYQFAMTMNQYPGVGFVTFNIDCGCMLIWKMPGKQPVPDIGLTMNWDLYKSVGSVLLNVTDEVEI